MLPPAPVAEVRDIVLAERLACRLYRPHAQTHVQECVVLFFHGGGWVIGDLDTHDSICRHLAVESACSVIAVDYRVGPEHRFPAAVIDATEAYRALVAIAPQLGFDPGRIGLAGDSAGGALAVVAALSARLEGLVAPSAVVLFYPVADLRGNTESYAEVAGVPITRTTMSWFRTHYLASPSEVEDWRTSPLLAPSLHGLSPTFITTAGHDPLCDEGFALVERLRAEGLDVTHRHLPGQVHGYLTLGRMLNEARLSIAAAGQFLKSRMTR